MPLDVSFIKSYISVGLEQQNSVTFDDVQTMVFSFARIHSKLVEEPQVDELPDLNLLNPFETQESAKIDEVSFQIDFVWKFHKNTLPTLPQIAMVVLSIPHINAGEEIVFSIISKKIKTKFWLKLNL